MSLKKCLLLILTLLSSVSLAKGKRRSHREKPSPPYKYYYMLPVGASNEWTFSTTECQEISKEDYKFLSQKESCQVNGETKKEVCLSRADVELKNSKTNEKKKFDLSYVVFATKQACDEDRVK